MSYDSYHKRKIGKHLLKPETQMMGYGYDPSLSEGSLKPPIFLTSTFVFKTAQDGKDFFDFTSGRREPGAGQSSGLVYSRFNNPNLEVLPAFGVSAVSFTLGHDKSAVAEAAERACLRAAETGGRVCLIMVETPANPTNSLVDLALMRETSVQIGGRQSGGRPPVAVDNTFLGPVFQRPLGFGADLVMYSLTKYVGGHSDLVAGGVVGSREAVAPVKKLRGALGTQLDPNTAWMIMRSMETLTLRMHKSAENAALVANFLRSHPKIASVNYLGFLATDDPRYPVFRRQCQSAGSTFGFAVKGGEAEAFRLLDALQVIKLAVSLGGTETLMSHPASTTHSGVPKQTRDRIGITDALIRISVGIEDADDLIADLAAALDAI